jgi:hypothetical protein
MILTQESTYFVTIQSCSIKGIGRGNKLAYFPAYTFYTIQSSADD